MVHSTTAPDEATHERIRPVQRSCLWTCHLSTHTRATRRDRQVAEHSVIPLLPRPTNDQGPNAQYERTTPTNGPCRNRLPPVLNPEPVPGGGSIGEGA